MCIVQIELDITGSHRWPWLISLSLLWRMAFVSGILEKKAKWRLSFADKRRKVLDANKNTHRKTLIAAFRAGMRCFFCARKPFCFNFLRSAHFVSGFFCSAARAYLAHFKWKWLSWRAALDKSTACKKRPSVNHKLIVCASDKRHTKNYQQTHRGQ